MNLRDYVSDGLDNAARAIILRRRCSLSRTRGLCAGAAAALAPSAEGPDGSDLRVSGVGPKKQAGGMSE